MKQKLSIMFIVCGITFSSLAQNFDKKIRLDESKKIGSAIKSQEQTLPCLGERKTPTTDLKWRPILTNNFISNEPKIPDQELIEKIIEEKTTLKNKKILNKSSNTELSTTSVTPIVGTNYLGNLNTDSSPMDNSIAISNGGWIISVANNTIEYDNTSGTTVYYNGLLNFINDSTITGVCDPVVLYDSQADRFIFFCQTSPITINSKLLVFFSKTNNPNDGWWYYKLNGNPLNNGEGFDYPKMAVSNNELYISGNLFFQPSGTFDQAILYQITKSNGYSGGSLSFQYWTGITGTPFTLLPVSLGQQGSYGPGCYLVSTTAGGASTIKLYDLTDDMTATNEQLNYYSITTPAYSLPGEASQLGTTCKLDNGDCRALSGFYLNGIIHFVFHSDIGTGWNGINYNRLNLSTLTNQSSTFGAVGVADYSYPSVVSYSTSSADKSVMIGFGRTSPSIYPEIRVVNCDDSMNWSGSTLVKSSINNVHYTSTTKERWGDYTGTSRKHNSSTPSIWMNGMYGNASNKWQTWIAEIHDNQLGINDIEIENKMKIYPNPVLDNFYVEFTLDSTTNLNIEIVDINGRLVKSLYNGNGNVGANYFSFNKASLSSGLYFLVIKNNLKTIKNEKIIIN